jgi:N-acetyl-gamma-glutamyl-phosphate reductase
MNTPTQDDIRQLAVGIVGARGYAGAELIRLVAAHPRLKLQYVVSRALAGQRVDAQLPDFSGDLRYSAPGHADLPALGADIVVLALPNGQAAACVAAFDAAGADPIIVDLSADYRFDEHWYYGLPELTRGRWHGGHRISNPGC